jgi:hypothetical protein
MRSLPTPGESVYDEFGELLELPDGASYKEFARKLRRLYTSLEVVNRIRVRFERGKRRGAYPALTEYLAGLTCEEQETFFRTGGLQSVPPLEEREEQPWDAEPYNGDSNWYRNNLHDGMFTASEPEYLPSLAKEWLEELTRVGYRGVTFLEYTLPTFDGEFCLKLPARQKTSSDSESIPRPLASGPKAVPAIFDARLVPWLELDVGRSERGHREIKLNDEPLRTDVAILGALIAMEARPVDLNRLQEILEAVPHPIESSGYDKGVLTRIGASWGRQLHGRTLDLALMLLRYHRAEFDRLTWAEQVELLERACGHINEFLNALRRVVAFLEHGTPGRELRSAKGEAEKHIEAAVLKHVYGLSTMEIARQMGEPIAPKQKIKNDPATVRQWVRLGTRLLRRSMGKERWWAHVEAMKAEAERWNGLTEDEQEAEKALEAYAEARGISWDRAREEVDQDDYPPDLNLAQRVSLKMAKVFR